MFISKIYKFLVTSLVKFVSPQYVCTLIWSILWYVFDSMRCSSIRQARSASSRWDRGLYIILWRWVSRTAVELCIGGGRWRYFAGIGNFGLNTSDTVQLWSSVVCYMYCVGKSLYKMYLISFLFIRICSVLYLIIILSEWFQFLFVLFFDTDQNSASEDIVGIITVRQSPRFIFQVQTQGQSF